LQHKNQFDNIRFNKEHPRFPSKTYLRVLKFFQSKQNPKNFIDIFSTPLVLRRVGFFIPFFRCILPVFRLFEKNPKKSQKNLLRFLVEEFKSLKNNFWHVPILKKRFRRIAILGIAGFFRKWGFLKANYHIEYDKNEQGAFPGFS